VFEIQFKKSVKKDLQKLSKAAQKQVLDNIQRNLTKDPYQGNALSGEFKGLYRWRTGHIRAMYAIQNKAAHYSRIKNRASHRCLSVGFFYNQ